MRSHYSSHGAQYIANELNLSISSVNNRAGRLGLTLKSEIRTQIVANAAADYMRRQNPMKRQEVVQKIKHWRASNPEAVIRINDALTAGHAKLDRLKPSKLEIRLREILTELNVCFDASFVIKTNFIVDIRIDRLIIQADGDYWHGHTRFEPLTDRQIKQKTRDKAQDAYLISCGYTVARIWESDLTKDKVIQILMKNNALPRL